MKADEGDSRNWRLEFLNTQSQPISPTPVGPTPVSADRGQGETILVVDDDASVRDLVVGVLIRRGYRVLSATSATNALAVWAEHGPAIQLLLTDIVMPGGVSGGELAAQLLRERPELPVLYMSGYAQSPTDREFVRQQGKHLLQKPFTIDQLAKTVRAHLSAPAAS